MNLKDKRVVVTGASSGIGLHLTQLLIKDGARVVGVARKPDTIRELGAIPLACDLNDPQQIDAMLEEATRILGGIDIFVSNAGFAYYGPIGPADWEKNERIFKTNVLAPIYILQKLTEQELTEPLTVMITVSALGKMVLPGFSLYDATKFAMDGFVRTYQMEKPHNLKVVPVYPVATFTNFWDKAGGNDTPIPLMARQKVNVPARCMEQALKYDWPSVYPSLVFLLRCLFVRVLPVDLIPQAAEKIRMKNWIKRHQANKK